MDTMQLRILGPVELRAADRPVYLSRRQERLILGILAIEVNRVVRADRLIDLLWGSNPPQRARAVIQTRVSGLRSTLAKSLRDPRLVLTRDGGYVLNIEPEQIDLHNFRALVSRARSARSEEQARDLLRTALDLWRGAVLGGWLPADSHAALCSSIDSARLSVSESLFELELSLGNHISTVDEMTEIALASPGRERLTALAMTALHRSRRTAEALQLFELCRRWLADELGVDPGNELRELHLSILTGDTEAEKAETRAPERNSDRPSAAAKLATSEFSAVAAPQLLPTDVPDFVGREAEVERLSEILLRPDGDARLAIVSGPAGVGKTALCVHVAHQLRGHFPDGQLYVDLHGFDQPQPAHPREVLARFLRALGVESHLPDTLDERAELYRNLVAGRKMVVVLDNANDINQVRTLLPGSTTCAVIVNSRVRLAAAIGGEAVDLEILDEAQAFSLLSRIAGPERIGSEYDAAASLVTVCGGLPLAIRIAGARLVAKSHWTVAHLAERLTDERNRLDQLAYGDLDVRASITLSYAGLNIDAQRLLCRLGDLDLPEINVWSAAALLDQHPADTEELLEQLHDAQLLDVAGRDTGGFSRYRLHDLVRLFAKERAASDESAATLAATRERVYGCWLDLLERAYGRVYGSGSSENMRSPALRYVIDDDFAAMQTANPLSWFMTERHNLVTLIGHCARDKQSELCWGMACTAFSLFEMCRFFEDSLEALNIALLVATETGDDRGRGAVLHRLATHSANLNNDGQAMKYAQQASELLDRSGDSHGHSLANLHIGIMHRRDSRNAVALPGLHEAIAGLRLSGDLGAEAFGLRNIAQAHISTGDHEVADDYLQQALDAARRGGSLRREVQVLFNQGMLRLKQDRVPEAHRLFVEVLALTRTMGDRPGQIQAHRGLALCYEKNGDLDNAEASLITALHLARQPTPTLLENKVRDELSRLAELRSC